MKVKMKVEIEMDADVTKIDDILDGIEEHLRAIKLLTPNISVIPKQWNSHRGDYLSCGWASGCKTRTWIRVNRK